ncbi:MAG: hypothetical protein GEV04_04685 [Actinophytocola sp.]|nr:hypothetical protein [Actinophytocola sp.]
MLFPNAVLERIVAGEVDLAFRRWRRPGAVAGRTQRTAAGVIAIDSVEVVRLRDITATEARRAGWSTRTELLEFLRKKPEGRIYRIGLHYASADARVRLREQAGLSANELTDIVHTLSEMDRKSRREPWTRRYLELIDARPAELALDLARSVGRERLPFKADVRRLKELGLTESLRIGYQLSPRGRAVLEHLRGP